MARASTKPRARFGVLAGAAAAALLAFPGAASAAVTSSVSAAGALSVNSTADDAIAITCVDNQVKVNGDNPNTGMAACDAITSITVNGGPDNNLIDLSGVADEDPNPAVNTDFPKVGSVFIEGNGGNDTIRGSEHADEMLGGDGHDRISGDDNPAGSRDVFEGGSGDDTMAWNPGDDDDTMDGQTGTDTVEVNGGGGPEQFTVKPSPTAGRVQFDRTGPSPLPGPFNLDIGTSEKLGMNAGGGDDSFTAEAGLDALGFKLDVDGGPDNDTIDGGDGADSIGGGDGNDTINADDNPADTFDLVRGDAGDDIMIWNGGDDNDVNDGALATTPPGSTGPPSARSSRSGPGRPRDGRSSSASTRPRSAGSRSTSEPRRFST